MKLGQIMTLEVEVARPEDTVQRAAEIMRDADVGFLPVVEGEAVVGVVTDRDIVLRFVADALDYSGTAVTDVMTRDFFSCFEDQDVEGAAQVMEDKRIRRMVVLSREGKLVGVVSLGDLARREPQMAEPVLEQVSQPGHGEAAARPLFKRAKPPTGTESVSGLIRDELSALETYKHALDKVRGVTATELRRMEDDHEKAAAMLQEKLAERGIEPPTHSGSRGAWVRFWEGAATVLGDKAVFKALKDGEESGIKDYERVLDDDETPPDIRALIRTELLPQARAHIPVLDRFLSGRTPPGGTSYNADQGYGPAGGGRGVA